VNRPVVLAALLLAFAGTAAAPLAAENHPF
jgi:hypothetical protein